MGSDRDEGGADRPLDDIRRRVRSGTTAIRTRASDSIDRFRSEEASDTRSSNSDDRGRPSKPGGKRGSSKPGGTGGSKPPAYAQFVPERIRESLLVKLGAGLLLILLIAALTSTVFYFGIADELEETTNTEIRGTATLQSDVYAGWMSDRFVELESIGSDSRLNADERGIQSSFLESELRQSDDFVALYIVDINSGEVLAGSDEDAVGKSLYDVANEDQIKGSQFVTSSQYTNFRGETVIAFGNPLGTRQGEILVGEVNATGGGPDIRQTISDSRTTVVNEDGGPVLGMTGVPEDGLTTDDRGVTEYRSNLYATVPLDNDLYLVTETPKQQAFAVQQSVLRSFILTILITVGATALVVGIGGRSLQRSITTLAGRAQEMEDGNLSVDLDTSRTDEIGALYRSFDGMRTSLRERITEAETALEEAEQAKNDAESARQEAEQARKEAEQAQQETERVNEQIRASADEYSDVMEAAADGDLTVRMTPNEENEAMAAIAADFNEMIAEFETVVEDVKGFAGEVASASEEVTASSREVRSASEQVNDAIQQIYSGSLEQDEALQEVTTEMDDLSATIEEIAASSDEVAQTAELTARAGRDGRDAAEAAIDGMETIRTESEAAVEEIEDLERQVEQVDELIARIGEIADQTSILALNANIEAARASGSGGGGAGFGVVATEVKDLAEDAKEAAEEIEERLESIRGQTEQSVEAVRETSEGIRRHTESVENAVEALDEIAQHADETNDGIQDISTGTDEQAATADEVVAMIEDVADIARRTSEEAERTAATAEEQTASMTEVSESASQLSDQAAQLSEALDRFETGPADDEGTDEMTADTDDHDGELPAADDGDGDHSGELPASEDNEGDHDDGHSTDDEESDHDGELPPADEHAESTEESPDSDEATSDDDTVDTADTDEDPADVTDDTVDVDDD